MALRLYNTLTRSKDDFEPIDPGNVRMYVCGPTVYDYAHIGNARPVIVFDILFRLLRSLYGRDHVTYVRNITDVDDKINARAFEEGSSIRDLTERTAVQFHEDIAALGVLPPTVEPRATDHVEEMKSLIEALVAKGHAYVAEGHVLFDVPSLAGYGRLSGRTLDEMEAGARIEVAPYKKDAMDFVLWKPSKEGEPGWPSPCGIDVPGRPGWHIECSAMAGKHLGQVFDIHGGGIDLVFPHHENELAQSCAAHGTDMMARWWLHNGFLQVEGEKMSKSLGNFITIRDLLETNLFGGRPWPGSVIRLAMLKTHYRQPIDWTLRLLEEAEQNLKDLAMVRYNFQATTPAPAVVDALLDDLNTKEAIDRVFDLLRDARAGNEEAGGQLAASLALMGLFERDFDEAALPAFAVDADGDPIVGGNPFVDLLTDLSRSLPPRMTIGTFRQYLSSDAPGHAYPEELRERLIDFIGSAGDAALCSDVFGEPGITIEVNWLVDQRIEARQARNWAESDRLRDELAALGIKLNDGKNAESGAAETSWEVRAPAGMEPVR
ncbi:MAG: cysteine--tRNA ligase [Hyphomicrobiaceae bacterium]|nr:cysteine--tRNA ligase [Hyphomicrobiaceae bacterium]